MSTYNNKRSSSGNGGQSGAKKRLKEEVADAAHDDLECSPLAALFDGSCDFFPPLLVQFLQPKPLVKFKTTSKRSLEIVNDEVERRKGLVAEYEEKIRTLIGVAGNEPPSYTRKNVLDAQQWKERALKLVAIGMESVELQHHAIIHHPFRSELEKFTLPEPGRNEAGSHVVQPRSPLSMLPTFFYIPLTGEPVPFSRLEEMTVRTACRDLLGGRISDDFEDHMLTVFSHSPSFLAYFRAVAQDLVFKDRSTLQRMEHLLYTAEQLVAVQAADRVSVEESDSDEEESNSENEDI